MAFDNIISGLGDFSGAVQSIFQGEATAGQERLQAKGNFAEARNYELAAELARKNEEFVKESTAVKLQSARRELSLVQGQTQAQVAGAGLQQSGSAMDIIRGSAQQGGIQQQLIGQQGLITEAGYEEQSQAFASLSKYAMEAGAEEERLAQKSKNSGFLGGIFKGIEGLASIFGPSLFGA